jgi:hypothetical protein
MGNMRWLSLGKPLVLAACIVASGSLVAQSDCDYLRTRIAEFGLSMPGTSVEDMLVMDGHHGDQIVAKWSGAGGVLRASLTLPFHRLAGTEVLQSNPFVVLVYGTTYAGAGVRNGGVVALTCQVSQAGVASMAKTTEYSWPGIDPCRVARVRDSSVFWMLDYSTRSIRVANTANPGTLPTASEWQLAATATQIPILASPSSVHFADMDVNRQGVVTVVSKALNPDMKWELTYSGGQPVVSAVAGGAKLGMKNHEFLTGQQNIQFRADASLGATNWNLVDGAGSVLASGSVLPSAWTTIGQVPQMWQNPGREYRLEFPGVKTNLLVRPSVRYAPGGSTSPDFTVGRAIYWPSVVRGDARFGSGVEVSTALNGQVVAFLAVGVRQGGVDPVSLDPSGVYLLNTNVAFAFTFDAQHVRNSVGREFPIPDDPAWDDQVVLFQYWFFLPNQQYAVSEVFGVQIQAGEQVGDNLAMASVNSGAPELSMSAVSGLESVSPQPNIGEMPGASPAGVTHVRRAQLAGRPFD